MADYYTKKDWWLIGILWACAGLMIFAFFVVIFEPVSLAMKLFAAGFFGIFFIFTLKLCQLPNKTYYSLQPDKLVIHVGKFKAAIKLQEITEVHPTRNPLSAPAWSLDRLHIRYTSSKFGMLISPEDKNSFMQELAGLASHLELKNDRLIKCASDD